MERHRNTGTRRLAHQSARDEIHFRAAMRPHVLEHRRHVREVIRGTTFPAGHLAEPGHVVWDTKGDTHIGPFEPSPAPMDKVRALADACTRAGMPTVALEDARGAQWRKLIFNAASNAIGALTGLTHGRVAEPPTRDLAWAVMAEGRRVADAQGIVLDTSPEDLFDYAARKDVAYDHKPSMLQDIQAGRETEIDFLNATIAPFRKSISVSRPAWMSWSMLGLWS